MIYSIYILYAEKNVYIEIKYAVYTVNDKCLSNFYTVQCAVYTLSSVTECISNRKRLSYSSYF